MKKTESGLHEIKNKRRPRAVKDKKEGLHLHAKKRMSRTSKAIVTLCAVLVLVLGVYGIGSAFFKDAQRNTVDLNYGSPSVPVEEGEVYSLSAGYTPVDVFARLNWKFSRQSQWYAEMHGTVDTVIQQSITTYKQYENGILISADLTESSLIKSASQFCYLKEKDRVMWRKPASKNYDGLNTEWQTGAPYNIMTIGGEHGFKATNGLPAYELSVYVIEEDTVANASPVTMTEDGRFKITYELKPETWQEEVNGVLTTKGATAYYVNQMIFTGGLTTPPEFNAISVTFTFDENWQVFQTDIEEKYSAKYGPIAAPCVSTSTTKYEYNTEKAHSGAYEEYFYQYAEGEVNDQPVEKEITALDCLAEGFGSVLTEPTVLDLDLKIGDTPYHGVVDLDLSKTDFTALDLSALSAKVKLGPLSLWAEEGNAYLNYGGLKVSLKIDELVALVKDLTAEKGGGQAEEGEEPDLLSALAGGEFTLADGKAELHSVLPLLGLDIPVDFYFTIGENREIAVEKVTANISVGDSLEIGAQVSFGKDRLPALGASEKAEYVPLMPYVNELIELFSADVLHADISYKGEGIAVSGGLDLRLNELALAGEVQADVSLDGIELSKKVKLSYTDGVLYLDLDGIKVQATVEEGIALLEQYITLPELPDADALSGFDLGALINILLSDDFADLFSSSEENGLRLAVKGSELLSAFGVDFALGDVTVTVNDGKLSVAALGAEIGLSAGTDVALDTQGYTSILPYVQTLIELFSNENLAISVSYTAGDFTVMGEIMLSLASEKAAGEIVLGYRSAQKTLSVIYGEGFVYLSVEGVHIKAGVSDAVALISSLTGAENDLDAKALINRLLALDFGSVISLGEENDTLTVLIKGTELLRALGVEFELGKVTLSVDSESIKAEAFGAEITVKAGKPFETNTDNYIDIVQYANTIATMIEGGYLSADVSYISGKLTVSGKIDLALETLEVQGTLTLAYGEAHQDINIIYGGETVYLELGGMKISAGIQEAVALIGRFIELPAGDSQERDLIEELLSLDFTQVFTLTEEGDTLSLAIAGTELLNALGVEFELGEVTLSVDRESIKAEAFGAEITVKAGKPFETNTDNYIDIVKYAETIATMIEGGYLSADVSYISGKLTVSGKIELALETFEVQGSLTLTYGEAHQDINIIYGGETVYLEIGGMKISAGVQEAVALIGRFIELPAGDSQERDLIEELLSLNFEQVFTLTEEEDTLSLAIAGTELLNALGVEFELGKVTLLVDSESLKAEAFGAEITVKAGTPFTADTTGYIDIVQYAETIAAIIEGGYLSADVSYTSGKLTVTGKIDLALETLEVQGNLTLIYGNAKQNINIIYGGETVYLEIGGMKISAGVQEAVALIGRFIELPAGDSQERDLIEELLSLNFEQVFTLTKEGDTLSLAIAGTELLNALGVEFELGGVEVAITQSGTITVKAVGATIEVSQGTPFTADTTGYIDIVQYANTIATMIEGGYLSADVSYTSGELTVTGKIELALETLEVQGTLTLTYGIAQQDITVIYGENVIYLELGGMKISAGVQEAVDLIGRFIELPAGDSNERDLIEELLSLNFEKVFTLTEEGDTLSLAIAGTELLNALGVEFELGKVMLSVDSESLKAEALGAEITVKAGTPFETNTDGYIDIVQYANTIATMIESGYLSADVTYSAGKLNISGKIDVAFDLKAKTVTVQVQADLTLVYGSGEEALVKRLRVGYAGDTLYLTVFGADDSGDLKVSLNANEAIALVTALMGMEGDLSEGESGEKDLIEQLLSMHFETVFTLTEEGDTLSLAIAGTELLNALGIDFDLKTVTLSVDSNSITAEALGAKVTVKAGTAFAVDTEGFFDLTPVIGNVRTVMEDKAISLCGDLVFTVNGFDFEIEIEKGEGILSFADGLKLYLHATIRLQKTTALELYFSYDDKEKTLQVAYGALGATLKTTDFKDFESALLEVYKKLRSTAAKMLAEGSENPLPDIGSLSELLTLLQGGDAPALGGLSELDWTGIVKALVFRTGERDITVGYKEILARLFLNSEYGFLGAELSFSDREKGISVDGSLYVDNAPRTTAEGTEEGVFVFPQMPLTDNGAPIRYLTKQDVIEVIDYLGAAVELLNQTNLSFGFDATVSSSESDYATEDPATNGIKYRIKGSAALYFEEFPLTLDTVNKSLRFSSKAYIELHFELVATLEKDTSLYLDIIALDSDLQGQTNGYLDFYITASTVGPGKDGYDPMKVYAPADELMTVLAGLVDMLGVDVQVVNDYFVTPWLSKLTDGSDAQETEEIIARLKTLGLSLLKLFKVRLPATDGAESGTESGEAGSGTEENGEAVYRRYIKELTLGKDDETGNTTLTLTLNGADLFGAGKDDLVIVLAKGKKGDVNLLKGLSVTGISSKKTQTDFALTVDPDADLSDKKKTWVTPNTYSETVQDGYFDVQGVDKLILSIAKSVTHPATEEEIAAQEGKAGEYLLNKNYYIDGVAALKLSLGDWLPLTEIKIKDLSLSVDVLKDGSAIIKAHLAYDGLRMALGGIFGDTDIIKGNSELDVTIRNNPREGKEGMMLYMKRTQTSHFDGRSNVKLPSPEVLYRALPLENFMADYINQLCFMFNLSQTVMENIMNLVGNGGGSAEKPKDVGGKFKQYVLGCSLEMTDSKNMQYTLNLNGQGLTGSSSFEAIPVVLGVENGLLRTITAAMSIAGVVDINADLRFRNPGGTMDGGVTDITTDISETLEKAMDARLQTADWKNQNYLEGQLTTITYWMGDRQLGEQEVIFDPTTHESFASLVYPSLDKYKDEQPGYTPVWDAPADEKVSADLKIYAKYRPNTYHLVFKSKNRIDGATALDYVEEFDAAENMWLYKKDWTFGTDITLPFGENDAEKIACFVCAHGHEYTPGDDLTLHIYTDDTIEFTADWEYIEYKVEFMAADGTVFDTKTGHYGDSVGTPEGEPQKAGYTFRNWENAPATFTSKTAVRVNPVFQANTYEVTILSEHDIPEGFGEMFQRGEKRGDLFVWTLQFTYDTRYTLPQSIRLTDEGVMLKGFLCEDNGETYFETLPNVLKATTFTAVWQDIGFDIVFEYEDGVQAGIRNLHKGDKLTSLPEIDETHQRKGYTASWDVDVNTFEVDGPATIKVKYTGITYVIYGLSRFYIDGFEHISKDFDSEGITGNEFYYTRYEYTYGTYTGSEGGYHLRQGLSESQLRYDFAGWYTTRFGTSTHGEATKVEYINDGVIESVFHFNEGAGNDGNLAGKNILYADWIDNSVNVVFYSDFDFEEREGNSLVGDSTCYYMTKKLMGGAEENYNVTGITVNPKADGLLRLGWWYNDPEKGWRQVENVNEFRNDNTRVQATVELFAMWVEKIEVRITTLSEHWSFYDIGGTAKGGNVVGTKSAEIFTAAGMVRQMVGVFKLYGKNLRGEWKEDSLQSGQEFKITTDNGGSFSEQNLTSANAVTWREVHGGVLVTVRFKDQAGNTLIETCWESIVSFDTYEVTIHDVNGDVLKQETIRTDYERDEYDNAVYLSDILNGNELFGFNGYRYEKEGWTFHGWKVNGEPIDEEAMKKYKITGDLDIYADAELNKYTVRFESEHDFGNGWQPKSDNSGYYYEVDMEHGAIIDVAGKQTVVKSEMTISIPKVPIAQDESERTGTWQGTPEITEKGATFTATYPSQVTYYSVVQFTMENCDVTGDGTAWSYTTAFYNTDYKLLTPTATNYTFLGWFINGESGWKSVTELNASEVSDVTVEALWAESMYDFTISGQRKLGVGKYTYSVSITGETQEKLIGAFANENVNRTVKREFYIGTEETPKYVEINGTSYNNDFGLSTTQAKVSVRTTVTYTDEKGNILCEIVVEESGSFDWRGKFTKS